MSTGLSIIDAPVHVCRAGVSDAIERRDNLAAYMYEMLYDFVIRRINKAVSEAAPPGAGLTLFMSAHRVCHMTVALGVCRT